MTQSSLYVDVHVLQTVPPSNLNRDDAGSPKEAIYGGTRRARISSQAWKRATRQYFAAAIPREQQATRTATVGKLLAEQLIETGGLDHEQADRVSVALLAPLKIKPGKKEGTTSYLLFLGRDQINRLAKQAASALKADAGSLTDDQLKSALAEVSAQEALLTGHPLEVALFGRMVADLALLNVDAAVQVAHAISTHPVEIEFDYFTAVDDERDPASKEQLGAGMIGTVEYNSATLYRYATVAVHQLVENLGGAHEEAEKGVVRFLEGFVRSMPTGHQNAFAHRTLPDAVVVVARQDQPVNLVSAFESPLTTNGSTRHPRSEPDGNAERSVYALASELRDVAERWGGEPSLVASTYRAKDEGLEEILGRSLPFASLLAATSTAVGAHLAGNGS